MKSVKHLLVVLSGIILLPVIILSCEKKEQSAPNDIDKPKSLTPYSIVYPAHFPKMQIPDDNQPYIERIQLGRMLYYDTILSNDGRACASCHHQQYGFTIPGVVNGMPVLPHVNLGWCNNFMWDGSKRPGLEDVMLFETREFFATNLEKINRNAKYRQLFKDYYNVDEISYKDIAYALAQFTRIMISGNTKYDRYLSGTEALTADEEMGRRIFFSERGDCFHCHSILTTTDYLLHNTGLDSTYIKETDKGYYNVSHDIKDIGKFRTPNLRNVALRSRYMHDGRFKSLEEVINFYDHNVNRVPNIDPIMTKAGKEDGLNLKDFEKQQLIAFLNTLTDSTFITDTSFSRPSY